MVRSHPPGAVLHPRDYHRVRGVGGELGTALVVGVVAEALVLSCALVGVFLHRRRVGARVIDFTAAAEQARRTALAVRITDARIAELSELAVDTVLRELGLESGAEPDLGIPGGLDLGSPGEFDPPSPSSD